MAIKTSIVRWVGRNVTFAEFSWFAIFITPAVFIILSCLIGILYSMYFTNSGNSNSLTLTNQ